VAGSAALNYLPAMLVRFAPLLLLAACGGSSSESPWPVEPLDLEAGPVGEGRGVAPAMVPDDEGAGGAGEELSPSEASEPSEASDPSDEPWAERRALRRASAGEAVAGDDEGLRAAVALDEHAHPRADRPPQLLNRLGKTEGARILAVDAQNEVVALDPAF
jgi:hypothetical protein